MQRRRLLKFGAVGAAALAAAGGMAWLSQTKHSRPAPLSPSALQVLVAVAIGLLEGSLPADEQGRKAALPALSERLANMVNGLPHHSQRELVQLLSLMTIAPGRWAMSGLHTPWANASEEQLRDALETMRSSGWALRQQAYHALRDLVRAAWYSAPSTWVALGYPGPRPVA